MLALAACGQHSAGPAATHPASAIQVVVDAPGPPSLLERMVTIPIERSLSVVTGLSQIRSAAANGRVVVTVELVTPSLSTARQEVVTRLRDVQLPQGVTPQVGPLTSPDGALVRYALHGDHASSIELRTLQDWTIRPALMRVPGIADVSTCGGLVEQLDVTIDPAKLGKVTLADVATAIGKDAGQLGRQRTIDDIANEMVKAIDSAPIRVDDLATVARGHAPRRCVVMDERSTDVVEGTAWLRVGTDRERVGRGITAALDVLRKELPPGITLDLVPTTEPATLVLPDGTLEEQLRLLERLRGAGATLELGDDDGGYQAGVPNAVRVRLASPAAAAALAERAKAVPDAVWIGEAPTAWIAISGPDLDELGRIATQLTAKLEVVEHVGTQAAPSLEVTPDRPHLLAASIAESAVLDGVRAALEGLPTGELLDHGRKLPIVLHVAAAVPDVPIGEVKLGALAQVRMVPERRAILREHLRREVRVRVRVVDLAALREQIRGEHLPLGYEAAVE